MQERRDPDPVPATGSAAEERHRAAVAQEQTDVNIDPEHVTGKDTILDIRRHPGKEQIRGALRYDPKALREAQKLVLPLDKEGHTILDADNEEDAAAVARRLREMGARSVRVLRGGIDAWRAAGKPTEPSTQEQPIPGESGTGIPLL